MRQSNGSNVTWALRSRAPTLSEVRSQRGWGGWGRGGRGYSEQSDMICLMFQQVPSGYCTENRFKEGQGRKQETS